VKGVNPLNGKPKWKRITTSNAFASKRGKASSGPSKNYKVDLIPGWNEEDNIAEGTLINYHCFETRNKLTQGLKMVNFQNKLFFRLKCVAEDGGFVWAVCKSGKCNNLQTMKNGKMDFFTKFNQGALKKFNKNQTKKNTFLKSKLFCGKVKK